MYTGDKKYFYMRSVIFYGSDQHMSLYSVFVSLLNVYNGVNRNINGHEKVDCAIQKLKHKFFPFLTSPERVSSVIY